MFGYLVRLIVWIVAGLLPWVLRLIQMAFMLTITALTSIFVGVPESVNRISDSWVEQASESGLPVENHEGVRNGAKMAASITLILGWIVLASLTVWVLRMIFGW